MEYNQSSAYKKINVLLVSTSRENLNLIKVCLEKSNFLPCHVFAMCCKTIKQSARTYHGCFGCIDIMLLDLDHVEKGQCCEVLGDVISHNGDVPVIVITSKKEHDLALKLIEYGAAESLSIEELSANPARLPDAIEFSIARYQKIKETQRQLIERQRKADMKCASKAQRIAIEQVESKASKKLEEKDQVIFYMSGGYSVQK